MSHYTVPKITTGVLDATTASYIATGGRLDSVYYPDKVLRFHGDSREMTVTLALLPAESKVLPTITVLIGEALGDYMAALAAWGTMSGALLATLDKNARAYQENLERFSDAFALRDHQVSAPKAKA